MVDNHLLNFNFFILMKEVIIWQDMKFIKKTTSSKVVLIN